MIRCQTELFVKYITPLVYKHSVEGPDSRHSKRVKTWKVFVSEWLRVSVTELQTDRGRCQRVCSKDASKPENKRTIWHVADRLVKVHGVDNWVVPRDAQWNEQKDQDCENRGPAHAHHRKGPNDKSNILFFWIGHILSAKFQQIFSVYFIDDLC